MTTTDNQPRPALHQHDPHAGDGRGAEGQLRPSRARRWARRRWPTCCGRATCATIPPNPRLARPRPLRPLGRARLDAALQPAPPHRLRPVARRARSASASGAAARRATPSTVITPGVEATTGPLGQGFANAVGHGDRRALPRRALQPPRPRRSSTTARTSIVSDGDLMEGVAAEAASLAGHLGLGKLVYLYDDNRHHARRRPRPRVHRGRRPALRGLRLARPDGRRRQRPRGDRPRRSTAAKQETQRPSLDHRARRTSATAARTRQARRSARRAARRGRGRG